VIIISSQRFATSETSQRSYFTLEELHFPQENFTKRLVVFENGYFCEVCFASEVAYAVKFL
jgi:hypothetical protein